MAAKLSITVYNNTREAIHPCQSGSSITEPPGRVASPPKEILANSAGFGGIFDLSPGLCGISAYQSHDPDYTWILFFKADDTGYVATVKTAFFHKHKDSISTFVIDIKNSTSYSSNAKHAYQFAGVQIYYPAIGKVVKPTTAGESQTAEFTLNVTGIIPGTSGPSITSPSLVPESSAWSAQVDVSDGQIVVRAQRSLAVLPPAAGSAAPNPPNPVQVTAPQEGSSSGVAAGGIGSDQTSSQRREMDTWAEILKSFLVDDSLLDLTIPKAELQRARGLVILRAWKAGFGVSGKAGSGLVIARLATREWSAPLFIDVNSIGFGFQIGVKTTDLVIVLNNDEAIREFFTGRNVTVGGGFGAALGSLGAGLGVRRGLNRPDEMISYSRSQGVFAGVSLSSTSLTERKAANVDFYGPTRTARHILDGTVTRPKVASEIYTVLKAAETP